MGTFLKFEDIEAWKRARELAKNIQEVTEYNSFLKDLALRSQIRRAIGSVMDNIAEGFDREGNKEFIQFLSISKGSIGEVKSQLYRSLDFKHISQTKFDELYFKADDISKMISRLSNYLQKSELKGLKYKINKP